MSTTLLSSEIAEPYTQALMSLAQSNGLTEQFGESCRSLVSLFEESPEFREFIANPIVKDNDKKSVLRRVMGEGENPYLMNFLMLLVDKRRIVFLEAIVKQYLKLLRDLNQVVLAEITSAKELTEEQKQAVIEKVKAIGNARNVEIQTTIDPNLLGGVIIKVGSQVLDASIRGQLRRIRMSLS
jgi:F-type H+-transporting ATPase subunit delta